jgi:hypothetical protein
VAVGALVVAVLGPAGPAVAAKGGSGTSDSRGSSLSVVLLGSTDAAASAVVADEVINHGDSVTFTVKTTSDRPFVGLRCYQGDAFVYDAYVGYFPDYYSARTWFVLDSTYWAAGVDARCDARLISWDRQGRENVLATTSFAVAP